MKYIYLAIKAIAKATKNAGAAYSSEFLAAMSKIKRNRRFRRMVKADQQQIKQPCPVVMPGIETYNHGWNVKQCHKE